MPHGATEQAAEDSVGDDFNARGWNYWPDNEDLSNELMRLLGAAQEGGSTISECLLTAGRIDPKDEDRWYREWIKTAGASKDASE